MKKLLSLLLVLCMLTGCAVLSSCGSCAAPLSTKDVENDAQGVLSGALNSTTSLFFSDNAGMAPVVAESLNSGSFAFAFEGAEADFGMNIKLAETLYFNRKNHQYVSDTSILLGEEELAARIFVDKTGIALSSESILGNKNTLAVNFGTLIAGLDSGFIKDLLTASGSGAEDIAEIKKILNIVKTEYEALFAENASETSKNEANAILALMNQVASEETIKNENGDDIQCVVVSYTLTNSAYKAILNKMIADFGLTGDMKAEAEAAVEEMLAATTINLSQKIYINKATRQAEKLSLNGTVVTTGEEAASSEINAELVFGTTEMKFTLSANDGDKTYTANVVLTKEETDSNVTYKLVVNADDGTGVTVNFLNLDYTYTKGTGAVLLSASIYDGTTERLKVSMTGNIAVTKTDAKIEITSVTVADETVNFKLSVAFSKNAEIPARPADTKDIATLTEEEWQTIIMDAMEKGILGQIMGQPELPDPEI